MAITEVVLGWEGILTAVVLGIGLIVMAFDLICPEYTFVAMNTVLLLAGVMDISWALGGYANTGLHTVMLLFIVAAGIEKTGGMNLLFKHVMGKAKTVYTAQLRLLIPVSVLSAFINNTPVVALLIPFIQDWCKKNPAISKQKLLIPLSYSAVFGGTCTLIGTSTNLVIAGLQTQARASNPAIPELSMFSISPYGIPYAIFATLYMLAFSPFLLPPISYGCFKPRDKKSLTQHDNGEFEADILVGLQVLESSPVVGKTVEDAGMRHLDKMFLISVERGGDNNHAVPPSFVLQAGDIMFFAGDFEGVEDFAAKEGLIIVTDETEDMLDLPMGRPEASTPHRLRMDDDIEEGIAPDLRRASAPVQISGSDMHIQLAKASLSPSRVGGPSSPAKGLPLGLAPASFSMVKRSTGMRTLVRVRVKVGAELLGRSIRQVGFRSLFQAAVLAVTRNGKRVPGKIGDVVLEVGDTLVLDPSDDFNAYGDRLLATFELPENLKGKEVREFMAPMKINAGSSLVGKTVEAAGLRGLPSMYLVDIYRADGTELHAVAPETVLQEGDSLWFCGSADAVASLRSLDGMEHQESDQSKKVVTAGGRSGLVQVVVAARSPLVGRTVRESSFRSCYNAAIIAVHRQGERLHAKIGDIRLNAGDVLLLDADPNFCQRLQHDQAFALLAEVNPVTEITKTRNPITWRMILAATLAVAMILSQIVMDNVDTGYSFDLYSASVVTAALMLLSGCLTQDQANESLEWGVFICIGASLGFAKAMDKTKVAQAIADVLVYCGKSIGGSTAVLTSIYIATALLSEVLSNNSAAAIMYPVSLEVAQQLQIDYNLMAIVTMMGASAGFMMPHSYQCNLMVYGAGGYRSSDFFRFGVFCQLTLIGVVMLIVYFGQIDKNIMLIVSLIAAGVALAYPFIRPILNFLVSKCTGAKNLPLRKTSMDSITESMRRA